MKALDVFKIASRVLSHIRNQILITEIDHADLQAAFLPSKPEDELYTYLLTFTEIITVHYTGKAQRNTPILKSVDDAILQTLMQRVKNRCIGQLNFLKWTVLTGRHQCTLNSSRECKRTRLLVCTKILHLQQGKHISKEQIKT
ncbi:unnamed protein product [Owenia fusiformis]|uniref:Uncharacterized protein n=1 Tax=Owenia fusiformis TaxID=6347 RepID=A0A8J1Y1Q8_OWEFU|nr:unnamed protein product [Owenia fusiformis]